MHGGELLSHAQFVELSTQVQDVLKRFSTSAQYRKEILFLLLRVTGFILGFFIFSLPLILAKVFGILLLSYTYYGIGITGTHETAHRSFVASKKINIFLGYVFSDFWVAQSSLWWHYRHVQVHHVFTNIPAHEPKIFYYRSINAYIYFFFIPYLVIFWLVFNSIKFLRKEPKKLAVYLACMGAGFISHTWLFTFVTPTLGYAILSMILMRVLFAPMFVHLAMFNHAGLPEPASKPPWLPHQSQTTRNLRRHWFIDGMGGNAFVECHIEHHLFPNLSNHMLQQIHPVVRTYLESKGYTYKEEGYVRCLALCIKEYRGLFATTTNIL